MQATLKKGRIKPYAVKVKDFIPFLRACFSEQGEQTRRHSGELVLGTKVWGTGSRKRRESIPVAGLQLIHDLAEGLPLSASLSKWGLTCHSEQVAWKSTMFSDHSESSLSYRHTKFESNGKRDGNKILGVMADRELLVEPHLCTGRR